MSDSIDIKTVDSFGDEWSRFNQQNLPKDEAEKIFNEYFAVFPWNQIPEKATGFDLGCGSGRWSKLVAPRVGHLHCIDPSSALEVAKESLQAIDNVSFHRASVDQAPLEDSSQDFGYALGVLHHIPDTEGAMKSCTAMLKSGAPFLVYIYYKFDNRSRLFKLIWRISDLLRRLVYRLPASIKLFITDLLAAFAYFPLARISLLADHLGLNVESIPLSHYRHHSFYTMRTDSRDRFGTLLEQRFTRKEIEEMMKNSNLVDIRFSDKAPFWCAVGIKE